MVPEGWRQVRLGQLFDSSRERGRSGLPTMSVTLSDGLVPRESLERKSETNLSPTEHLRVRPGDIAYNMMRMWQGASGLVRDDAIVSPAYVVLRPSSEIDPLFASYFFKAARTVYLFWAYSYGLTKDRLRLYYPDFSLVPAVIPPIEEQRRIGNVLATWDRAIEATEKLVEAGTSQRKALLQQLMRPQTHWRIHRLGDVAEIFVSNVDKKTHRDQQDVRLCNYTDVYHNDRISGDLDLMPSTASAVQIEKFRLRKGDVLITKDSETPGDIAVPALVEQDLDDVVCGYHLAIVRPKREVNSAYLSSLFSLHSTQHYFFTRANGATRYGLTVRAIADAVFALPGLSDQLAAAQILKCAEGIVDSYKDDLARLTSEKASLMQQLLTGKRRVLADTEVDQILKDGTANG